MSLFRKPKDYSNSYEINLFCENCEETYPVRIKKGTKVEVFVKEYSCPNCGCKTVRQSAYNKTYY